MARLTVRLHGEEVSSLTLESGNEYIAGRAQDAQIHLAVERGISRHHLKFVERDGVWVCESLSKFTQITRGGKAAEVIELHDACVFTVTPYEFHFEPTSAVSPKAIDPEAERPSENLPAFYQPRMGDGQPAHEIGEHTSPRANNEATMAGVPSKLVPYFRISYPNTADDEVLKLEGHLWVAGRDHTCEIPIESPHVSRKHFELSRTKEGFFITDLGSSNGTKVNGVKIPPHEPTRVESGDEIAIKNVDMVFEIRDLNFSQRVEALPVPAFDPMLAAPPAVWYPPGSETGTDLQRVTPPGNFPALRDWRQIRLHHFKQMDRKKLILRGVIGVLLVGIMVGALLPDAPKPAERNPASGQSLSFEKLTQEQRSVVKDSFNLARNLYVQGKYELCLTELAKLHELIPQYENSKELQSFCDQGRELVHRQRDLERKERERQQIEQQIATVVEGCKAKLHDEGTVDETRQCLAQAMELDPEHHLIIEMIHTAQMHAEEKAFNEKNRQEEEKKAQRGVAHYRKAKDLHKKGELAASVAEYERYINTPYPKSYDTKETAKRELASIKQELKTKVSTLLEQCKALGGKGHYRDAYIACDKAVSEDPNNSDAKENRGSMLSELKRELKGIYEDSVLEESLGNVDSAKEKWRKIMKDDLEGGEYYKKAKGKLKPYGVGL
jgi:pSer/pThr/pTyr-binding forkhead associated (FHA) protein/tetratricopeptide (TPR) repeat protein